MTMGVKKTDILQYNVIESGFAVPYDWSLLTFRDIIKKNDVWKSVSKSVCILIDFSCIGNHLSFS